MIFVTWIIHGRNAFDSNKCIIILLQEETQVLTYVTIVYMRVWRVGNFQREKNDYSSKTKKANFTSNSIKIWNEKVSKYLGVNKYRMAYNVQWNH
jgi:hypothetical protein